MITAITLLEFAIVNKVCMFTLLCFIHYANYLSYAIRHINELLRRIYIMSCTKNLNFTYLSTR